MTVDELQQKLGELGYGVLKQGAHEPQSGACCALEFANHVRGRRWSDEPGALPDLRPLNDAPWSSDQARTEALLPVMAALWDWSVWSEDQRVAWSRRVAVETVCQIVADLPGLPEDVRQRCREATTCDEARDAAARAADPDAVLRRACQTWIAAAHATTEVA